MGDDLFIPARWFTRGRSSPVDVLVWHTGETLERSDSAEGMGRYFAGLPSTRKASAHHGIDSDSTVGYVHETDVAYAAPGANHNGVQVELAGRAAQDAAGWRDDFSRAMLGRATRLGAEVTDRYKLPLVWLSPQQLRAGMRGHTSHWNVSLAFGKSTHTDPGVAFPHDLLIFSIAVTLGGLPSMPERPGYEDQGPFVWVKPNSPEEHFWRDYLPVSKHGATHRVATVDPASPPPSAGKDPLVYAPVPGWGGLRLGADRRATLKNMLEDAFGGEP